MSGYERLQNQANDVELQSAYPQLSPPPSSSSSSSGHDEGKHHEHENHTGLVYGQQPVVSIPVVDSHRLLPVLAPVSFDGSSSSSLASSASIADPQPALAVNAAVIPPSAPAPTPAGAPRPQQPTQFVPVVPPVPTVAELEERIKTRQVEFECGKYLSDAWTFFRHNACSLLLISLFWGFIGLIFYVAIGAIVNHALPCYDFDHENCPKRRCRFVLSMFLWVVSSTLVFTPMVSSAFGAMFNALRTNSYVLFRHAFGSFRRPYYWRLLRLSFALNILHALLGFLIIPGIWFSVVTTFSLALHLEHNITSCKSIALSVKLVHRYFCRMLGFILLLAIMQVVGAFCLLVGLLVALPISLLAVGYCYHHLVGVNGVAVLVARPVGVDYI